MLKNFFKNPDWENVLGENEKKELEFGISLTYALTLFTLTSVCGVVVLFSNVAVGLTIVFLGFVYFLYLTKGKHFIFTDRRIIMLDAFIGREEVSVDYSQITDIELEQSPFDQMGSWGTLTINTAGTRSPEIKITFVNNPQKIKQELDTIRHRKNRG